MPIRAQRREKKQAEEKKELATKYNQNNMNWKQFKTWLDKNIVENEGLMVKIKIEKQDDYGFLSTTSLTNFATV